MKCQERQCEVEGNCGKADRERWIAGASMMVGAVLGAAVTYFCDPHRGKARRAELEQKAASAVRQGGRKLAKNAEDLLNRAKGAVANVDARFERRYEAVDDDVIAERVRSHMGHMTEHAGDIQTEVVSGVVALRRMVSPDKHRLLVDEILTIPGVSGIRTFCSPTTPPEALPR
jgi:gas vesicle protein